MAAVGADWLVYLVLPALAVVWYLWTSRSPLQSIPGPRPLPLLGNVLQLKEVRNRHKTLHQWHKEFGPVCKLRLLNTNIVVISGYDALHEALVVKGTETGGRAHYFRHRYIGLRTGILTSTDTDATWRALRKVAQRHLKQFGDGLSRLEAIIEEFAEDMYESFQTVAGKPLDPRDVVIGAAVRIIAFLLSGQRTESGDPILEQMETYEKLFAKGLSPFTHLRLVMYDWVPWLRHLRLQSWQEVHQVTEVRDVLWAEIKDMARRYPESRSFARLLLSHCHDVADYRPETAAFPTCVLTESDAKMATANLLFAGMATTSNTFYAAINILAHKEKVQQRIAEEIERVVPPGDPVAVKNKPDMPYTRAFLYELLRYTSIVALGVVHRAVETVQIVGYTIPEGTRIQTNLWALHHDPEFWKDPEEFRPERFLDEHGDLLLADHPNRKHLMPFGAGTRVCLGESLALTRLFIWTAALIQRFRILPAEGNTPDLAEANSYVFAGILASKSYRVIFHCRK